jgi:hypothetical protein
VPYKIEITTSMTADTFAFGKIEGSAREAH